MTVEKAATRIKGSDRFQFIGPFSISAELIPRAGLTFDNLKMLEKEKVRTS